MSSILKALKKVEMESAAQTGSTMPWQAPSSMPSSSDGGRRRWWMLAGFIAVLAVSGLAYWQVRWAGPRNSAETVVPASTEDTRTRGSHPDNGAPEKNDSSPAQLFGKTAVGADPATVSGSKQTDRYFTAVAPNAISRKDASVKGAAKSPAVATATPASDVPASGVETSYEKMEEPVEDTAADEENTVSGKIAKKEEEKNYREDPRITLQALVWAPEPGSRFVVINNKMIREGGVVDNIVVEKINPDDVLLSEGANRWYVAFTIR